MTVTHVVALAALEWIRVDGRLHFSSVDSSQLSVSTVLVTPAGTLSIGTPERPVDPEKTVRLVFAGRPSTVRQQDSFDILGGVIALGRVEIYGAPKAGFATPSNVLEPAVSRLVLDQDAHGTALLRTSSDRTARTTVSVPGDGRATVTTYDGAGRRLASTTTTARTVAVAVPAGGFATVRR